MSGPTFKSPTRTVDPPVMVSSPPGGRRRARFRSIFLSDVHLGSPRAQAELLLDFLAKHQAEYLFLVGDIADDADEFPLAAWPEAHRAVLEALRHMAREGTRVHYMTGNHDPRFLDLWGPAVALEVARELEHTTADGRRLWIVHGDGFDEVVHRRRWLSRIGDALARGLEHSCEALERLFLARRGRLGRALRERCKGWLGYTARFERSALVAARSRAVDGIVCGHVHSAASRTIDGLYYGNGGDWVGSATALVEHVDGRMELLSWDPAA
jgi:UDP-2,3-diacylglucosamine pyrophosphatase LpxH